MNRLWHQSQRGLSLLNATRGIQHKYLLPIHRYVNHGAALNQYYYFSTTTTSVPSSDKRPFDKVLIANRGEISQRISKTCQNLGIETVAIYSTADAKAPFVQAANEAVCVGPAQSSKSYLQVENVIRAIQDTGAQAVHPGYGFLSENADFCEQITKQGVAWLGPPVPAIQDMGDKIRSKEIAAEAGVTIIPGHDGTVDSVQQALELANNVIGYPILLKAAAGGGGKGMRICSNDKEVKEGYPMAKAEAKNYFNDDRILIEKYILNPHHIEFQVLCSPKPDNPSDIDVVVFPERECSIQRRNQKIIEESPSCLLTEETRQAMVEQVKKLCRNVGYASAGTVEWLVDEEQNFYFLEMNTRLQVEHPITEAVTKVDLVKGMLWVGAGWGLPPEFQLKDGQTIMPYSGHAVEARIYAEDPTRGYLPSTGPLIPYIEPTATGEGSSYLRMDSGVTQGHVVSPFYDPMLSKIIAYAPTRQQAIDDLANGLDNYVIEGVQHNAKLVNGVLRHEVFQGGNTPTSFLQRYFPDFAGVELTPSEQEELAVAVALIGQKKEQESPPIFDDSNSNNEPKIVRLEGMFGSAFRVAFLDNDKAAVQRLARNDETDHGAERIIATTSIDYDPFKYIANVTLDGQCRSIQVLGEDATGEIKVQMYGADMPVLIQTPREYELSSFMHEPIAVDTSDFVMSPMPGTLVSVAVSEGDTVEIGQELCIVEAMKMQNIIRSPRTGTIAKVVVKEGSSLMADDIIVEYVKKENDETVQTAA